MDLLFVEPRSALPGRGTWLLIWLLLGCTAPEEDPRVAPVRPGGASDRAPVVARGSELEVRSRLSRSPVPFRLGKDDVVAEVAGEEIRKSDVYDYFYLFEQTGLLRAMQQLVDERLVRREAERLGVSVEPSRLAEAVEKQESELATRVRVETGGRLTVERYLEEVRNLTLEDYRSHTRRVLETELLLERLARFQQLREDRAEARILAVRDRAEAERFREEVLQGADFDRLAKEHSLHPSAPQGGRLPAIGRGIPDPLVEVIFSLRPGATSAVQQIVLDDERLHYFVQLLEMKPGRVGTYAQLQEEVLASLAAELVAEHEYLYWRQLAGERYDIDLKF